MRSYIVLSGVAVLAMALSGCSAEEGACPDADDCACPCSDETDLACGDNGIIYQNSCVLECDGATAADCPAGGAACAQQCAGTSNNPVCGRNTDGSFSCYNNGCLRTCAGAANTNKNNCTPRC